MKVSTGLNIPIASPHFIGTHQMARPYAADHAAQFGAVYLLMDGRGVVLHCV